MKDGVASETARRVAAHRLKFERVSAAYGDPEALKLAIGSLPAGQRSAIEMLKLREMSLKEAAEASGSSISALKVATHRAMDSLRKKLIKKK